MKNKLKFCFLCLTALYLSSSIVFSAPIHPNAGKTSIAFLKIGMGARAVGMGESFVSVADDIYSLYWNPAGLSKIPYTQITATHSEWFQDIRYEFIGFSFPLGLNSGNKAVNSLGISIAGLYITGLERRNWLIELPEDPPSTAEELFGSYDIVGTIAYSHRIADNFLAGLSLKIIYEKIDIYYAYDFAFDISGLYNLSERVVFGLNIQHIGPKIKFIDEYFWLPMNIKFGVSYKIPDWGVISALSFDIPYDNYLYIKYGVEWNVFQPLFLRAGYRYRWYGNELGDLAGLTAGVGFKLDAYQLDYAFVPYGDLGLTHRISFTLSFGETKKDNENIQNRNADIKSLQLQMNELDKLKEELRTKKDRFTPEQIKEMERMIKQKEEMLERMEENEKK